MSDVFNEIKKKFAGVNTLDTLVEVVKEELQNRVSFTDVIDNLASEDENKPLSANQGRVLKELINNIESSGTGLTEEELTKIRELVSGNAGDFLTISQVLTIAENDGLLEELGIEEDDEDQETEEEIKLVSAGLVKVIALSLTDAIDDLNNKIAALEEKVNIVESNLQNFEEISESELMDIWNRDVVRVGSKESLADAIADVAENGKIVLSADQELPSKLEITKNLALDLGGKTLTNAGDNWVNVSNGAKLTVTNGTITGEKQRAIHVTGGAEVIIGNGATIEGNGQYTVVAYGGGKLNIGEGSKITNTNGSYPVFADNSEVTISGGEIESDDNVAIVASNKSNVTINNVNIISGGNGITAQKSSTIVIEDAVVNAKDYAISAVSGSNVTINGGNFAGKRASVNKSADSTIVVKGGTFSDNSAQSFVQGGTLKSDDNGWTFVAGE